MEIRNDDLRGPEIAALLAEHLECMAQVSPPESRHALANFPITNHQSPISKRAIANFAPVGLGLQTLDFGLWTPDSGLRTAALPLPYGYLRVTLRGKCSKSPMFTEVRTG